jgi:hypothetical protein
MDRYNNHEDKKAKNKKQKTIFTDFQESAEIICWIVSWAITTRGSCRGGGYDGYHHSYLNSRHLESSERPDESESEPRSTVCTGGAGIYEATT